MTGRGWKIAIAEIRTSQRLTKGKQRALPSFEEFSVQIAFQAAWLPEKTDLVSACCKHLKISFTEKNRRAGPQPAYFFSLPALSNCLR
jgi:hypothetical protein